MIQVLDHGFVRLVSYMQPAESREGWTGDLEVVRNARASYDAEWRTGEDAGKDAKLVAYLHRNRHTSPFEAMAFTFEVKAPIFVLRQWHRHRTWSYNEVSARYTEIDMGWYVPQPEHIGKQSADNKQMRELASLGEGDSQFLASRLINAQCEVAFEQYRNLLAMGVPRELARGVLPLNTYSRMFATVDLHNLIHFLKLRLHPHAQFEIQEYARALLHLIKPLVPVTAAVVEEA